MKKASATIFLFMLFSMVLGSTSLIEWNFENSTKRGLIAADGNLDDHPYSPDEGISANQDKAITVVGGVTFDAWVAGTGGSGSFAPNTKNWHDGLDSKYWMISLSTKGYNNLDISSKQRSSNTGPRDFQLQYSLNNSVWYLISSAISVGNNFTTGVLTNLMLPAECEDQDLVYLRWIMISNTGVNGNAVTAAGTNRIDDIVVTGEQIVSGEPLFTLYPSNLNDFSYDFDLGPSAAQSFVVSGIDLVGNIEISTPAHYDISLDESGIYSSSLSLIPDEGLVADTPIYVRLIAGLPIGHYENEHITVSSTDAGSKTVNCSGYVLVPPPPPIPGVLLQEEFNYIAGSTLTSNGWIAHSGVGNNSLYVHNEGLTYPGYRFVSGLSGHNNGNGEDAHKSFPHGPVTEGIVYNSFLINLISASTAGDYVYHLMPDIDNSTDFKAKLFVSKNEENQIRFGLTKASNLIENVAWTAFDYSFNTTYLVVLKYEFVPGNDNDIVSAWINPIAGKTEPTPMLNALNTEKDIGNAGIGAVSIRQTTITPTAIFDGIFVTDDWTMIFGDYDFYDETPLVSGTDTITIAGGNANITTGSPSEVPNPSFVASFQEHLTLIGAGPWDFTIQTTEEWVAYRQASAWFSYEVTGGLVSFQVLASKDSEIELIIGSGGEPTLPVELSHFSAIITAQNFVQISWTSQSESNLIGYNIYRNQKQELSSAIKICELIEGTNSSEAHSYKYIDSELEQSGSYYYWLQNLDMDGNSSYHGPLSVIFGGSEEEGSPSLPFITRLENAYPNPFNPNTNIRYQIKAPGKVKIDIYNIKGQKVRSFKQSHDAAGFYQINWDGRDEAGRSVSSGVYQYKMSSDGYSAVKRMVLKK